VLSAWAPAPDAWIVEQAGAAGVASETATRVLDLLGVGLGRTLLIEGAAGGVGSAAVQIAIARGATVIGTGSEGNHAYLRSLGAIPTTYGPGLLDRVSALAPAGVEAVFDTVGSRSLPELIKIAPGADNVVTIADYTAQEHSVRISVTSESPTPALIDAATLGAAGRYSPSIAATYPLEQIADAHARSQAGHVRGKLVIKI
jgi:NADPH:quinone reductase-like Zn-dependent oxidoreductase